MRIFNLKVVGVSKMIPILMVTSGSLFTLPFTLRMTAEPLQTSDDQKNNKTDLDITAKIRKAIVADKTLSTNAHNIKIVTQNGQVTLSGKVNSDTERDTVVIKAKEIAGAGNVTDNLILAPSS